MAAFCESAVATGIVAYETPQWIFDPLDAEFHFTLDVCATEDNAKVFPNFWSPEDDGLRRQWSGVCWMNPPYGKEIGAWIQKAHATAKGGDVTVVCLLPVRSNNEWWKWVIEGEVRFIRKKFKFVGAPYDSMFPVCVVVFYPQLRNGGTMKIWRPTKRGASPDDRKGQ